MLQWNIHAKKDIAAYMTKGGANMIKKAVEKFTEYMNYVTEHYKGEELEAAYTGLYYEFQTFLHGCFRFGVIGTKRYAQLSSDLDGVVAEYIRRARA